MAIKVFRGIHYAKAERFGLPVPTDSTETGEIAVCPQRQSRLGGVFGIENKGNPLSEDCLELSVFTPSTEGSRAVLVWICGGAFMTGGGEFARYDASGLAEVGDIVVVNISYRVGAFGFMYQEDAGAVNVGLEDQICALEWIRKHISEFGGDPSRVTVCGQSAGGWSIAAIMCRGRCDLFSKAIMFSAPLALNRSKGRARRFTRSIYRCVKKLTGSPCRNAADASKLTFGQLLEAQLKRLEHQVEFMPFCPVGEKTYPSGECSLDGLKEVLLTCQKNDAQPFVPLWPISAIGTHFVFRLPMRRMARILEKRGIKVQTREFSWHPYNGGIGACHTLEVPLMLGEWEHWNDASMLGGLTKQEFEARGLEFKKFISDFVKSI